MNDLSRILLVEDDPDIQQVAQMALESLGGFEVKVCDRGQAALDALADFAPQMVLLDVMMPGMDGPTTLRELQQRPEMQGIPVAFMTAKVQEHEKQQYMAMGVVDVIAKPFDAMGLSDHVRGIWTRATAVAG